MSAPRPGKAAAEPKLTGADDLTRLALKACLIARDAAFNVRDLLTKSRAWLSSPSRIAKRNST